MFKYKCIDRVTETLDEMVSSGMYVWDTRAFVPVQYRVTKKAGSGKSSSSGSVGNGVGGNGKTGGDGDSGDGGSVGGDEDEVPV